MSTFAELRASVLENATLNAAYFAKSITYTRYGQAAIAMMAHVKYSHDLKVDESTGLEVYLERAFIKVAREDLLHHAADINDQMCLGLGSWSTVHALPTLGFSVGLPMPVAGDSIVIAGDGDRPYIFAFISETRTAWIRVAFERTAIRTQGIGRR